MVPAIRFYYEIQTRTPEAVSIVKSMCQLQINVSHQIAELVRVFPDREGWEKWNLVTCNDYLFHFFKHLASRDPNIEIVQVEPLRYKVNGKLLEVVIETKRNIGGD